MVDGGVHTLVTPPTLLLPRDAAFCPSVQISLRSAIGRACGEVITVYPPGIPLICPGEQFTAEIVDYCEGLLAQGAYVLATDASLATVVVLDDERPLKQPLHRIT